MRSFCPSPARPAAPPRGQVVPLDAEKAGDGRDALLPAAGLLHGVHAAEGRDAHAAPVPLGGEDLDGAHLAGALHMGRAAGAAVDPRDLHDAHVLRQLQLAAVEEARQLLRLGEPGPDGQVGPDGLVGQALDAHELLPAQLAGVVHGHAVGAHVEAHVVKAVLPVDEAGDDVLAGVVLHPAIALLPVHSAGKALPHGQGPVGIVEDAPLLFVHVQHPRLPDGAGVGRLAAALGEEGGPVQGDRPAALLLLAGRSPRRQMPQMAVDVIELSVIRPPHSLCTQCCKLVGRSSEFRA